MNHIAIKSMIAYYKIKGVTYVWTLYKCHISY